MAVVLGALLPGARAFGQEGETGPGPTGAVHRPKGDIDGDGRSNILMLHVELDHSDNPVCPDDRAGPAPHKHRSTHTDWSLRSLVASEGDPVGEGPWQVSATGDFNGDGNPDLFWQELVDDDGSGFASRGRIESLGVALTSPDDPHHYGGPPADTFAPPSPVWMAIGAGDFGGIDAAEPGQLAPPDGRDDLLWWNERAGALSVWISDGGAFPTESRHALDNPEATAIPRVVADLDGDGRAEIVAQDALTGVLTYWRMDGTSHESVVLDPDHVADANWRLVGAGDFDGDGMDDLLWRNDDEWKLVVWFMTGSSRRTGGFVTEARSLQPFTRLGAELDKKECHRWFIAGPR
jgi:hypothetical protein